MKTIRSFSILHIGTKQISNYWSNQCSVHIFRFSLIRPETSKVHDQTHLEIPPGSFMQCSELWATIPRHFQNLKISKLVQNVFKIIIIFFLKIVTLLCIWFHHSTLNPSWNPLDHLLSLKAHPQFHFHCCFHPRLIFWICYLLAQLELLEKNTKKHFYVCTVVQIT